MIVARQIDTQPWRWEFQGDLGDTSYVALEGDELVLGESWGGGAPQTYHCDLESFVGGSFHGLIQDTYGKDVLKKLLTQARAKLKEDRQKTPSVSRLPWEPGGATSTNTNALFSRPEPQFSGPTSLFSRSESLFSRSEPLLSRSEPLFSRPESLFSRPESLFARPESLFSRPDRSFQRSAPRLPWEPEFPPTGRVAQEATAAAAPSVPAADLEPGSVYITGFDKADLTLIFALKSITGRAAKVLKEQLRDLPFQVKSGLGPAEAKQLQERLDNLGVLALST